MGLYQRRRPTPIQIWPTRVQRRDGSESPDSPDSSGVSSPESSGIPSPKSSGLPSPKSSGLPSPKSSGSPQSSSIAESTKSASPTSSSSSSTSIATSTDTAVSSQISSQAPTTAAPQSTVAPPPPPSSSSAPPASTTSSPPSSSPTESPSASSSDTQEQTQSPTTTASAPTLTQSSTTAETALSSTAASTAPIALPVLSPPQDSSSTSASQSLAPSATTEAPSFPSNKTVASPRQTISSSPLSGFRTSATISTFVPAESELDGERSGIGRHRTEDHEKPILSKGAEAAAITLSIMGFIALVVGIAFFLKHRRRRRNESGMRHAEDAFNPNNNGSLHAPETAHVNYDSSLPSLAHMTKSSTGSNDLFASAPYERPETVSTKSNNSRIRAAPSVAAPQPTPNPFADPPRNKAYDQLRGRPRSTTLTDRGSWVKNPFQDPASERFDPFGELQEKARAERRKYVEEVRREAEGRRQREDEQEYNEKKAPGLEVKGQDGRKGSDVTVGGVGVLDRSGEGRWA